LAKLEYTVTVAVSFRFRSKHMKCRRLLGDAKDK
jgi:hypothetical protein